VDGTIDYYERLCRFHGGKEFVDAFCRLYITPGDGHGNCYGNGPGLTESVGMLALIDWVEHDNPPEKLRGVRTDPVTGKLISERELEPV
jgi:hypothetical protein